MTETICSHCDLSYRYDAAQGVNVEFVVLTIDAPADTQRRLEDAFILARLEREDKVFALLLRKHKLNQYKITFEGLFSICPRCETKSKQPVLQVNRETWPMFGESAKHELANETLRAVDQPQDQ